MSVRSGFRPGWTLGMNVNKDQDLQALLKAQAILLDWDGCLAFANRPHAAALEFMGRYRSRIVIVSNNSTLLPGDISEILARSGVLLDKSRILLAGYEALRLVSIAEPRPTLVLGPPRMKALAKRLGVELVRDRAEVVVLLRDTRFSYAKLERTVKALSKGARLVVANPDLSHPGAEGEPVPETGALLAAIAACVDLGTIDMSVIGKPNAHLFLRACETLGARPEKSLMIGDNPVTDIAGAEKLGMTSILVSPGSEVCLRDLIAPLDQRKP